MKLIFRFTLLILTSGLLSFCSSSEPKKSIEDLKLAFNFESTTAQKYTGYAQKATEEGFDTIAWLFIAVAKSEIIHASNYVKVIEKFGGNIGSAEIGDYEVKSTTENLQDAINNETYAMQSMYPGFIRDGEQEKAPEAAKAFTWAWDAEKKHIKYFRNVAGVILSGNETGIPCDWLICPTCGNVYNSNDLKDKCDFCLNKQENFVGYQAKKEE